MKHKIKVKPATSAIDTEILTAQKATSTTSNTAKETKANIDHDTQQRMM